MRVLTGRRFIATGRSGKGLDKLLRLTDVPTQQYRWVVTIPKFQENGQLPPGVHVATWREFGERFGWNNHRRSLLAGLREALNSLASAGCEMVYIDGSFVSDKESPRDFDGCWDPTGVSAALIDPVLLMFGNGRAAQKAKFNGELFPSSWDAVSNGPPFLEFFQTDRTTGARKGVVAIGLPGGLND
jgi:hypothetical protein